MFPPYGTLKCHSERIFIFARAPSIPYQSIFRCYRINYTLSIGNGIVHTQHQSNYEYSMINKLNLPSQVHMIKSIREKECELMGNYYSIAIVNRLSKLVLLCIHSMQIVAGNVLPCSYCHRCDFAICSELQPMCFVRNRDTFFLSIHFACCGSCSVCTDL